MSRIRIDFAARPGVSLASALLLLLALAACLLLAAAWQKNAALLGSLRSEAARLDSGAALRQPTRVPAVTVPKERAEAINAAIASLNIPWPGLLATLEASRIEGVSLLQLEPSADKRSLRVQAEAEDSSRLYGFAQALKSAGSFSSVVPLGQETAETDQGPRLRLKLEATWKP